MNPVAPVTGALGGFGMFAPGLTEVRRMDPSDPQALRDVRVGEAFGLSWSFVIVALIAYHEGTWAPLGYWFVGALVLVGLWEYYLQERPCGCG